MNTLPDWAAVEESGGEKIVLIDPAAAYEEAAVALTASGMDFTAWDQYRLEVARRCVTKRLKELIKSDLDLMNMVGSTGLNLRIARNDAYRLTNHAEGLGAEEGTSLAALSLHYQPYLNGLPKAG